MSTFTGVMNEFPGISVDRFDDDNLKSRIFFLSHCHMDHMCGLNNPNGLPGPLYMSPISAVIIRKQFPQIKEVVVLKGNEPTPIHYDDEDGTTKYVTVTTLPAFHCPGSVMFLFETNGVKVLYTGDFRLSKRLMLKMKLLKNVTGSLNTIYIDSTFLSKTYETFPGQIRSATTICDIIKEWLGKSSNHVISLKMPARYGYEFLFIEIGKRLKLKIHVNEGEMAMYRYIPELDNIFTTNSRKSQIHACFDWQNKNGKQLTCNPELDPSLIRVIKPTAMIWKEWQHSLDIVKKEEHENIRVCYSNHSSMSEIRDFLIYLQPKNVELNVVPADALKKQEMLNAVSAMLGNIESTNSDGSKSHLSEWDNLSKLSKLNFTFSKQPKDANEQFPCPPKRKKNS
ncbi:Protein artemis [Pseudolycoriella hygida]|uniref:Protein artemis n=1 Tax=Pseudolycoriella hygida TaxID=35572 RepID=A0A9Q0MIJ4_9DIPT|nr:Protein artemis [Pseudolycoriella hygida]